LSFAHKGRHCSRKKSEEETKGRTWRIKKTYINTYIKKERKKGRMKKRKKERKEK